ncbi:hypothetical protein [Parasitella parasitica]|uniref:F-box domain-containing protein n=1 Tax=Parasitella parasitica TaxID=35722 RepID=A0A0B7NJ96_9FUNG|nr:hypothetical protein [Parasitella parasitica]
MAFTTITVVVKSSISSTGMTTQSNTISFIPPELWQVIFSYLSARSNYECQRVCKTWYLPARRIFLNHIVLKNRYDLEEFLRCFADTNRLNEAVKKLTIGCAYTMPDRAGLLLQSEAITNLIDRFPNVQTITVSVNCIDLENFTLPHIMTAMLKKWTSLGVFRVNQILLSSEKIKIYLQTVYYLRQRMTELSLYDHEYVTKEMGGPSQFVSMFPRLKHLKIIPQQGSFDSFSDCLTIIQHCGQQLESLDMHSKKENEDKELLAAIRSKDDQEALARIKVLKLTMTSFCINTIRFIIQHFVGLQKVTFGFVYAKVSDWTENQKMIFTSDFLKYLCARREYLLRPLTISYKEEDDYLKRILTSHYTANDKKLDLHTRVILYNNNTQFGYDYNNAVANSSKFSLQLLSTKLQHGKLQRTSYFTHFYNGNNARDILDTFKVSSSAVQATSLTLDLGGMCIFIDSIPHLFYQLLAMAPGISRLFIVWPRNYCENNSIVWPEEDVPNYPCVTYLELTAGLTSWIDMFMLPLVSNMFPALNHLSMQLFSGYWHESSKAFVINLPQTRLTRLYLDVTPVRIQTGNVLKQQITFNEAFFILKVTKLLDHTTTQEFYYRVSLDYLIVSFIEDLEQVEKREYLTVHVIIKNIDYINLNLSQEVYEKQQETPTLLSMDPQKQVQTTVAIL